MIGLWILGVIISLCSLFFAAYETYEAYEASVQTKMSVRSRTLVKLVFLWLVAIATTAFTGLTLLDIQEKNALLAPPVVTKQEHDAFVAALKDTAKDEVQIFRGEPSADTANYIVDVRQMLDDAGYGVKPPGRGIVPIIGLSVSSKDGANIFIAYSDEKNFPAYGKAFQDALMSIGITAPVIFYGNDGNGKIDSGKIALIIVDKR